MTSKAFPKVFFLQFAPGQWSSLHRLRKFYGPPFPQDREILNGLATMDGHLDKAAVLCRVLKRLQPDLVKDAEQLEKFGGSDNNFSQEFGGVWEAAICELYSALDGLRRLLFGLFRNVEFVQNESNQKLFKRAKEKKYGPDFPILIRDLLAQSWDLWFQDLKRLRTQLVHGTVGFCHLTKETGKVRYFHPGLTQRGQALVFEDAMGILYERQKQVTQLVDRIADFFFDKLEPIPTFQMCGVYMGRWYGRMVSPTQNLNLASGHCLSWDWFESEHELFCPLASACLAYKSKWPGGSASIVGKPDKLAP